MDRALLLTGLILGAFHSVVMSNPMVSMSCRAESKRMEEGWQEPTGGRAAQR